MKDDLKLLELIKQSDKGSIDMPKLMYIYLPEKAFKKDEKGNLYKTNYMCSLIVSIMKYNDSKLNISVIDLPKEYNGEKIDYMDDNKYDWRYMNIHPLQLARYKGSYN